MTNSPTMKKFSECFRNRDGNFALLAGVLVPVLFMAGSLALDTTNMISMKNHLQNAVDSAALATATRLYKEDDLSVEDAKAFAAEFLQGQVKEDASAFSAFSISPTVTITTVNSNGGTTWRVAIAVTGTQASTPMARIMGRDTLSVDVSGQSESGTESSRGSISMALVLDKSGSMGWKMDGQVKINVLKIAVAGLLTEFKLADPEEKYVRVGGASYDTEIDQKQDLKWGTKYAGRFVDKLEAEGGTDSTDAFKWGYNSVVSPIETKEHLAKTGQEPERIIVFMTDGDNNHLSADSSTKVLCDKAKADGAIVYTIAFAAPTRGKQLLSYCATSPNNYFDAKNSTDLINAFKTIGEQSSEVVSRLTQ